MASVPFSHFSQGHDDEVADGVPGKEGILRMETVLKISFSSAYRKARSYSCDDLGRHNVDMVADDAAAAVIRDCDNSRDTCIVILQFSRMTGAGLLRRRLILIFFVLLGF